ncbi:hypothetical protein ACHAW6_010501 [Cyclotella cf. meneghiniana]
MPRGLNHRRLPTTHKTNSFAAFIMPCFIGFVRAFHTFRCPSRPVNLPPTKPRLHRMTDDKHPTTKESLTMDNIYTEWTIRDDKFLHDNRHLSPARLASLLGRGLRGVEARRKKLADVRGAAYLRLFAGKKNDDDHPRAKLTPVKEILRRIRWDPALESSDFSVVHYDRIDDSLCETEFDADNDSIAGKERSFVFALPEHRIRAVKYRERVVWERETRVDCVFGSMNGRGETIDRVVETYDEWKRERDEREERMRMRYAEIVEEITIILGDDRVDRFKRLLTNLMEENGDAIAAREHVRSLVGLFHEATNVPSATEIIREKADVDVPDDRETDEPSRVQMVDFLYLFLELVALMPNERSRETILVEVETVVNRYSKQNDSSASSANAKDTDRLPELREEDLEEKFVRGSGAGGQKINKTSNKVILLHIPTQLRVECQDTRSLQQNRKIARKRLQLKLDDLINGNSSRSNQKALKAVVKKSKNKARNKRRQLKKKNGDASRDAPDVETDESEDDQK